MKIAFRKPKQRIILDSIYQKIMLDMWIEIYLTGNISLLVKSGEFTEQEINENWQNVLAQYQDIYKDQVSDVQTNLIKKVAILNQKLMFIDSLLNMMDVYSQIVVWTTPLQEQFEITRKALHNMGYNLSFTNIKGDIALVNGRKQTMAIELRGLEKQLIALIGKTDSKPPSQYDFDEQIGELSKFQGHKIDKATTTVSEYVSIINRFKADMKAREAAANGK